MSKLRNEIFLRIFFIVVYLCMDHLSPYERTILKEEIMLLKYPNIQSIISTKLVCVLAAVIPFTVVFLCNLNSDDGTDLREAILCVSLASGLVFTTCLPLKLIVGKPRPNFYWKCFSTGITNFELVCDGAAAEVKDARMSFPSGHTAISFSNFGFISLYLMGKLRVYDKAGSGESWRVTVCFGPLILAICVSVSRYCDYHHDAIDILAGAIIGTIVIIICYHFYYPPFFNSLCDTPYAQNNN